MKEGDKVIIHDPRATYDGEQGVIVKVKKHGPFPYQVKMKDGTFWFDAKEVQPVANPPEPETPDYGFDRGFGIGGLGRHVEDPIIPTVEQMKRVEAAEAKMRICKRCGASDLYDGAMFTTIKGSGYCDDCVG